MALAVVGVLSEVGGLRWGGCIKSHEKFVKQ